MRSLLVSIFLAASVASPAPAQVIGVAPANPTATDNIVVSVAASVTGYVLQPIDVSGGTVSLTFRRVGADSVPIGQVHQVAIGRLPARAYVIVVRFIWEDDDGNILFDITHPPYALLVAEGYFVPALDVGALALLATLLAIVGFVAVRRA